MFEMLGVAKEQALLGALSLGAADGVRTRDPELGKLVLYQLSYRRLFRWRDSTVTDP